MTQGGDLVEGEDSFLYTPDPGFHGSDAFEYEISDGCHTDTAVVTIEVTNSPPVAADDAYSVQHNRSLRVGHEAEDPRGVLANDSDPENDPLTASVVSGPEHGELRWFHDTGEFGYVPTAGYVGTDFFVYEVSDGIDTAPPWSRSTCTTRSRSRKMTFIVLSKPGSSKASTCPASRGA